MQRHIFPKTRRLGRALGWSTLAVASSLLVSACSVDEILEVEDIDVTTPASLVDPANLNSVRALGLGDFFIAVGGSSSDNVVAFPGTVADEFHHIGSWQWIREADTRIIAEDNPGVTALFRNLHRARTSTQFAAAAFENLRPNSAELAEQLNLHAYTYVFFAENFCSGVPFSQSEAGRYTYGIPLPTDSIYNRAISFFDRALAVAQAANSAPQQNLARIGKARVLVGLNRYTEAAALVAAVPGNYVYNAEYSDNTTRQNNSIWGVTINRREIGVSNLEGGNGAPFRQTPADVRVPWVLDPAVVGFDTTLRAYQQRKYPARGTSIAVASGTEATLIRAEAALNRGASDTYLPLLNQLRAGANLPPLTDPGSPAARVDQYFQERAFWLFATGNRFSDLRRLVRQYGRNQAAVFPSGNYTRELINGTLSPGGTYGSDVSLPVPFDERNNPNFTGCLSRGA